MWDFELIGRAVGAALERDAARRDCAHDTRGVDSLTELELHRIIRDGLTDAHFHVLAEQRYPSDTDRRRSVGRRCDIVLTPRPGTLADPLHDRTLFAHDAIPPEDACWIEVKVVGQHHLADGAMQPNPAYADILLNGVMDDIRKLASDPRILAAAILLVLFNTDPDIARHDLETWHARAVSRALPVSRPWESCFEITDRHGNARCTVSAAQVHHL